MDTQDKMAQSKVERSMKILRTSVKVGANYLQHYTGKALGISTDRQSLDTKNAKAIFKSLNELKGSALKVAQMLSMDQGILPDAYRMEFAKSQKNAQPLSAPLVIHTFKKAFGRSPGEIFDHFELKASHAASIGQVHQGILNGKKVAIKIQYPGVAESIQSDLKLVRPFAMRLLDMSSKELDHYLEEVESKLIDETKYLKELAHAKEISEACKKIPGLIFPTYYPELCHDRVLVMDWIEGISLSEFAQRNNTKQEDKNLIGQYLWNFYTYQIHQLRKIHADPHPGNFVVCENNSLGILDFGCVKEIPDHFYQPFFKLIYQCDLEFIEAEKLMSQLQLLLPSDTPELRYGLVNLYTHLIELFAAPYRNSPFDFSNKEFLNQMYQKGEELSRMDVMREARGVKDFIYVNRTHFGLYHLLHQLQAQVLTKQ